MEPGLNIVGARNLNDPRDERVQMARRLLTLQTLDSPVKFLAVASKVFARTHLCQAAQAWLLEIWTMERQQHAVGIGDQASRCHLPIRRRFS